MSSSPAWDRLQIGNNAAEVTKSLREGKSGIEFVPQYRELGFRSQVAGTLKMNLDDWSTVACAASWAMARPMPISP